MGMVVVISLPFILFSILLGFGCYFLGRAKGRQDLRNNAQVFGVPAPPPGSGTGTAASGANAANSSYFSPQSTPPHQPFSSKSDKLSDMV
ncbi:uncharacterized protein LOC113783317 [Coffea eugenioides]|uniref:Uncharacterized protein n=1 Tax=Coffea arabica TaxID=13443 RepID=A0A6P6UFP1_COFAR|nr:uncharacterized protein LOC113710501 [Coffea arabica]XP_027185213.1 uncharacterized protein LOC113783317 [Coffea eugenioides]